jgi:nucleotide-binding universal stress UspA family protein
MDNPAEACGDAPAAQKLAPLEVRRILEPTDISELSGNAVVHAVRLGLALQAQVIVLYVSEVFVNPTGSPVDLGTVSAAVAKEMGVDLLVISTHGPSGFEYLIHGSEAAKIVRGAPCLVLVVHVIQARVTGQMVFWSENALSQDVPLQSVVCLGGGLIEEKCGISEPSDRHIPEAAVAQGPSRVGNPHPIDVVPIVPVR